MPTRLPPSLLSWRLALLAAVVAAAPARARDASVSDRIERAFRPPRVSHLTLSRDGRHLACALPEAGGGVDIVVFSTDDANEKTILPLGAERGAQVTRLAWTSAQRLIAATDTPVIIGIDLAARRTRRLLDESGFAITEPASTPEGSDRLIPRPPIFMGLHPVAPDRILVAGVAETEPGRHVLGSAWLDAATGRWDDITETFSADPRARVLFDHAGEPRVLDTVEGSRRLFRARAPGSRSWREWRDLDAELGGPAPYGFSQKPETHFGAHSFPVGFAADDDVLYYATSVGRDTFGLRAVSLRTKLPVDFSLDDPVFDLADPEDPFRPDLLVFDRARPGLAGVRGVGPNPATRWVDPELAEAQTELDGRFPDRRVSLLDWSDDRSRVLVRVTNATNPGRHFVYHRADGRCVEYLRRAPWLVEDEVNPVEAFAFTTPDGVRLTGKITRPRFPKVARPPLVALLHDGPGRYVEPGYEPRSQGLAALGFMVVEVNYRGSAGFGQSFRRAARAGLDRVPLADVRATLDWLAAERGHDLRRVALVGEGFGGYLALRATQEWPELVRCVATLDAPLEPRQLIPPRRSANPEREREELLRWIEQNLPGAEMPGREDAPGIPSIDDAGGGGEEGGGGGARRPPSIPPWFTRPLEPIDFAGETVRWFLAGDNRAAAGAPVSDRLDTIKAAVLLVHDPANERAPAARLRSLQRQLRRLDLVAEFWTARTRRQGTPWESQAAAWEHIGEFLLENLYRYEVNIGETKERTE